MNENMKMKRETEQKFILPCLCSFHEGLGLYLFGRLRISFGFSVAPFSYDPFKNATLLWTFYAFIEKEKVIRYFN